MTLTPAKYKAGAGFVGAKPRSCRIQATAFRFSCRLGARPARAFSQILDGERNA